MINKVNKPAAVITPLGDLNICATGSVTLQANSGVGLTYQWKKGASILTGETNSTYVATAPGKFKVVVSNSAGCTKTSKEVIVIKSCKESSQPIYSSFASLNIYPNPASDHFTIAVNLPGYADQDCKILIQNIFGQVIRESTAQVSNGQLTADLALNDNIAQGIYLVRLELKDAIFSGLLEIQK